MEAQAILWIGVVIMIIAILVSILVLLYYVGAFAGIDMRAGESPVDNLSIACKYCCDYAINVDEMFRSLIELCPGRKLVTIYYDNPADYAKYPEAKIRFCVGCVMTEEGVSVSPNMDKSQSTSSDEELMEKLCEKGFAKKQLPKLNRALHCKYPFTCSASVGYAERRVLGVISQIVKDKSLNDPPIVEIFDNSAGAIQYLVPLERSEDFLVPELNHDPSPAVALGLMEAELNTYKKVN